MSYSVSKEEKKQSATFGNRIKYIGTSDSFKRRAWSGVAEEFKAHRFFLGLDVDKLH